MQFYRARTLIQNDDYDDESRKFAKLDPLQGAHSIFAILKHASLVSSYTRILNFICLRIIFYTDFSGMCDNCDTVSLAVLFFPVSLINPDPCCLFEK